MAHRERSAFFATVAVEGFHHEEREGREEKTKLKIPNIKIQIANKSQITRDQNPATRNQQQNF